MQRQQTASGRKGAAPVYGTGAASRTGAKGRDESGLHASIIPQIWQETQPGGAVAVILRPGQAPEVTVTASTEAEQNALAELVTVARRLATLATGGAI